MRGRLKYGVPIAEYGVPIAAGLATGGYALSQGEDPGSAILAGAGGALGGAAGLLGARALAGKYAPEILSKVKETGKEGSEFLLEQATKMREGGLRQKALLDLAEAAGGSSGVGPQNIQRALSRNLALTTVPASALAAGLGGVALGAIPGSIGVPGFTQNAPIDPESYGSSNSVGARYKIPTESLTQYGV